MAEIQQPVQDIHIFYVEPVCDFRRRCQAFILKVTELVIHFNNLLITPRDVSRCLENRDDSRGRCRERFSRPQINISAVNEERKVPKQVGTTGLHSRLGKYCTKRRPFNSFLTDFSWRSFQIPLLLLLFQISLKLLTSPIPPEVTSCAS